MKKMKKAIINIKGSHIIFSLEKYDHKLLKHN